MFMGFGIFACMTAARMRANIPAKDKLRGELDMHMEHLLDDFRRLQSAMATVMNTKLELERENASLREKLHLDPAHMEACKAGRMSPPTLLAVALREDHPPENLEMEFAEAFPREVFREEASPNAVESREKTSRQTTLVMRADSGASTRQTCLHKELQYTRKLAFIS